MDDEWQDVSQDYINRLLSIYRSEYILLRSARCASRRIEGRFSAYVYPFTKTQMFDYVTATMVTFMLGELLYVFVAQIIDRGDSSVVASMDTRGFETVRDAARAYITGLRMEFKRKVANRDGLGVTMQLLAEHSKNGIIFASMSFDIDSGSITGIVDCAMIP